LPLPHYQLEAAIYAACAGRSLVADDLGLGLFAPALAAAELLMQHFGVERVLVLCAESAQVRWLTEAQTLSSAQADIVWGDTAARQAQLAAAGQIKVAATASLQQDLALLQGFAPELIIVDEAQRLDGDALAALKQLDSG
ncbi:ATP-dependent helicase, partial [Roseateles sp. GG27B]